ncbi:MAG: hypothetical protein J3Q66DRAFT_395893 [Benniella sp.]|nr:MAG: hypothetical protein J3Q66DRAFT_395893 [Benniella sp.]
MVGLNDKVFLPISIFVLNVILAAFKFVLVSAVAACFAIYAKYGGEYSNSVGWIRSAGYLEMIKTLPNTLKHKTLPGSVKWALVVAFFVSLIASLLDKAIASFINPTTKLGPRTKAVISSPQFAPLANHEMFVGWNLFVPHSASIEYTMTKAINSSIAIPGLDRKKFYDPVAKDYSVTCADFSVVFQNHAVRNGTGCPTVRLTMSTTENPDSYNMIKRSPNRWTITKTSKPSWRSHNLLDIPLHLLFETTSPNHINTKCQLLEAYRPRSTDNIMGKIVGLADFPKTSTTKCFHDDGNVTAIAITTIRLAQLTTQYDYNSVNTMFTNNSDELLVSMKETFKNTTMPEITDPAQIETSMVGVELRVVNSTIDIYACGTSLHLAGDRNVINTFECTYSTIRVLHFTQQLDDDIRKARRGKDFTNRNHSAAFTYMTIDHSGKVLKNATLAPISIEKMNDTMTVANYMARLDTAISLTLKRGNSTSTTMLQISCRVSSSLYNILRHRIASVSSPSIPRLMRFRFQPLMFEDVKLLPDQVEDLSEDVDLSPGQFERLSEDTASLSDQPEQSLKVTKDLLDNVDRVSSESLSLPDNVHDQDEPKYLDE